MDFAFSEEQEMLRKSARDFLAAECPKSLIRETEAGDAGFLKDLWAKMADLGWMGLIVPEEYGGAGFSLLDLAVLFEEFGRAAIPGPMFCTIALGALPILDWGTEEQKRAIMPGVATGETILTLALSEPDVSCEPRFVAAKATRRDGGFAVTGTKLFVPFAHVADHMLVVARTDGDNGDEDGLTVFIVDAKAPGIACTPLDPIARDKQSEVVLDNVPVAAGDILGKQGQAAPMLDSILQKASVLQCAQAVGGAQQELELTAEHARNRKQFDRPLGTFQAVQHRLADMFIDINGARWTTYQAVWRLCEGLPAGKEVAIAKAFCNIATERVAMSAQQLHGGLGVDVDYDLHYYFRRAKAYGLNLGVTAVQLQRLEAELGF